MDESYGELYFRLFLSSCSQTQNTMDEMKKNRNFVLLFMAISQCNRDLMMCMRGKKYFCRCCTSCSPDQARETSKKVRVNYDAIKVPLFCYRLQRSLPVLFAKVAE